MVKDVRDMDKKELITELRSLGGTEVAAVSYERQSTADLRVQLNLLRRLTGTASAPSGTPPPHLTPPPSLVEVPNVVGLSFTDAVSKLNWEDFTTSEEPLSTAYSDRISKGAVTNQRPKAHERVPEGTEIKLQVSLGPKPKEEPSPPSSFQNFLCGLRGEKKS